MKTLIQTPGHIVKVITYMHEITVLLLFILCSVTSTTSQHALLNGPIKVFHIDTSFLLYRWPV